MGLGRNQIALQASSAEKQTLYQEVGTSPSELLDYYTGNFHNLRKDGGMVDLTTVKAPVPRFA